MLSDCEDARAVEDGQNGADDGDGAEVSQDRLQHFTAVRFD
jgi:hypothetical protein